MSSAFRKAGEHPVFKNSNYDSKLQSSYDCIELTKNLVPKDQNIRIGTLDLHANCYYPLHHHSAAEVYVILSGEAEWVVDEEKQIVRAGDVIYHKPWAKHSMRNLKNSPLQTLWIWWSSSGDTKELAESAKLCE